MCVGMFMVVLVLLLIEIMHQKNIGPSAEPSAESSAELSAERSAELSAEPIFPGVSYDRVNFQYFNKN